eukprot:COSAG04_NODE_24977_length_314_cov_0.562791_1_plen_82_part_10
MAKLEQQLKAAANKADLYKKKIAQLEGARSRLEAEVASHVSASKERQELRIVSIHALRVTALALRSEIDVSKHWCGQKAAES